MIKKTHKTGGFPKQGLIEVATVVNEVNFILENQEAKSLQLELEADQQKLNALLPIAKTLGEIIQSQTKNEQLIKKQARRAQYGHKR